MTVVGKKTGKFGGVMIREEGFYWLKCVDPEASSFEDRWFVGQWDGNCGWYFPGFELDHNDEGLMIGPKIDPPAANPMIAEALANGPDATGLCTVREWALAIDAGKLLACPTEQGFVPATEQRMLASPAWPWGELSFIHDGKQYNIETVVTRVKKLEPKDLSA